MTNGSTAVAKVAIPVPNEKERIIGEIKRKRMTLREVIEKEGRFYSPKENKNISAWLAISRHWEQLDLLAGFDNGPTLCVLDEEDNIVKVGGLYAF